MSLGAKSWLTGVGLFHIIFGAASTWNTRAVEFFGDEMCYADVVSPLITAARLGFRHPDHARALSGMPPALCVVIWTNTFIFFVFIFFVYSYA